MIAVPPEIQPLLADRVMEVGPGKPNLAAKPLLEELARELPRKAPDRDFAQASLAGLWLLHNFFDESHVISQDLETVEGSYWHGILHRREPDYSNAKYWFRHVPDHPIFADLREQMLAISVSDIPKAGAEFHAKVATRETWDAFAFVDLCELAAQQQSLQPCCAAIQRCEWNLLFEYCRQRAFRIDSKSDD
jgi:hypothetical protein